MLKRICLVITVVLLISLGVVTSKVLLPLQASADRNGPNTAARDYALQDNNRLTLPRAQSHAYQPAPNPNKNLYWGELHIHTRESFDATLFGNALSAEDAYRFARGETLKSAGGEAMQLSRPLDFVAITDHAEGFGTRTHCQETGLSLSERAACWLVNEPNPMIFKLLVDRVRGAEIPGDPLKPAGVYQKTQRSSPTPGAFPTCKFGHESLERCQKNAKTDWARYVDLANQHNVPGELTTLIGYEFSPGLPAQGKHHRNIIFRTATVPERAISSFDVPNTLELWRGLEAACSGDCDFLTMPHNPNKAWGLTYSPFTWDGKAYTESDWRLRRKREPLVELFQVKGAQECALGVGATDEECAFEQVLDPCQPGETTGCAFKTGFVRQGLKVGLELEQSLGFNPLQTGFIAATDSHNSNPGDVEEWDFPGAVGAVTSSATRRLRYNPESADYQSTLKFHTSGGLAAVWAPENTREAVFDALVRRETYATSGPRIALRFYAGWDIESSIVSDSNTIKSLSDSAVPMGGVLKTPAAEFATLQHVSPQFYAWATQDPMDAPLQRLQMIKGWVDKQGQTHESVVDIACADDAPVNPDTHRCPNTNASVNLKTCNFGLDSGASELKTLWQDPNYDPEQSAFYYIRALMNPTCRWSTFDAIRLNQPPSPHVPSTIQERAWSSPIWYSAPNNSDNFVE
ncbi:MAG: DUF3604 domain-containing protein [Halieaceae bacterium]|nr:DUF3604 domain-containing protein [Halieaceae bacterium]